MKNEKYRWCLAGGAASSAGAWALRADTPPQGSYERRLLGCGNERGETESWAYVCLCMCVYFKCFSGEFESKLILREGWCGSWEYLRVNGSGYVCCRTRRKR